MKAAIMTRKTGGGTGWHQASPKTSNNTHQTAGPASRIKAAIVTLAVWGLIPAGLADWVIRHGGLRDV